MKITAIIQARMGSKRLPGKTLMKIQHRTIIWHVINRLKASNYLNHIVLATSDQKQDNPISIEAKKIGVACFRGDENDVLDRVYKAAKSSSTDSIVRITGDCPLIDPSIIDNAIKKFLDKKLDYLNSGISFPDGIGDCEVFSFKILYDAWKQTKGDDREHVTPYMWKNPSFVKQDTLENNKNLSNMVFSVDERNQYEAVKKIFLGLYNPKKNNIFHLDEIINHVRKHPDILQMTQNIKRSYLDQWAREQNMKKYAKSLKLLKEAKQLTPCAAQTYSKSYRYYCEGAAPAFLDRGNGSHVWDVDGNEFIDFVCALGAITVGHANTKVNKAISDQLKKGIGFSQATELEVKLARKLIEIYPSAEMVRFVKNGSDGTSAAVRLARAYTKREMVLVSGYHGYQEWYIGSTENDLGIPKCVKALVKKFEYNNIDSVKKLFTKYEGKIACVILEPVQGNGPENHFLEKLKTLTHDNGALLIFDEVVTGFRIHLSGAQGLFGVVPDLTALGKGFGNGLPISAVVGQKKYLKLIEEGAFISTTHGGDAVSLAGCLAVINILEKKGTYERMWKLGKRLKEGIKTLIRKKGLTDVMDVKGLDVHSSPVFKPIGNLTALDLLSIYQQVMIENGILVLTTNNLCLAHTEEDINNYLEAAAKAMTSVKKAVDKNSHDAILFGEKIRPIFKRDKNR